MISDKRNSQENKRKFIDLLNEHKLMASKATRLIAEQIDLYGAITLTGDVNERMAQYWANRKADNNRSYAPNDWVILALESALVNTGLIPKSKAKKNPFVRLTLNFNNQNKLQGVDLDDKPFIQFKGQKIELLSHSFRVNDADTLLLAMTLLKSKTSA